MVDQDRTLKVTCLRNKASNGARLIPALPEPLRLPLRCTLLRNLFQPLPCFPFGLGLPRRFRQGGDLPLQIEPLLRLPLHQRRALALS